MKYEEPRMVEIGSREKPAGRRLCQSGSGASLGVMSIYCQAGMNVEFVWCNSGAGDSRGVIECAAGGSPGESYPACYSGISPT